VAFITCLLSFVMQYVNLRSMFSLKWMFERGTLFSVGRLQASNQNVGSASFVQWGFSQSFIRNDKELCVCVCV
jgi:hypothetical protein